MKPSQHIGAIGVKYRVSTCVTVSLIFCIKCPRKPPKCRPAPVSASDRLLRAAIGTVARLLFVMELGVRAAEAITENSGGIVAGQTENPKPYPKGVSGNPGGRPRLCCWHLRGAGAAKLL